MAASRLPIRPEEVLGLTAEGADDLLAVLEEGVPTSPAIVDVAKGSSQEVIVFGDTHGDWRSTELAVAPFLKAPESSLLVGLGDYVDRAPADCGEGSVANVLFLLSIATRFPGRVLLLRGNHEANREVPTLPHDWPEEVDQLWGPEVERYARLDGLLERGPLAALLPGTAYFSHAGFPQHALGDAARVRFQRVDEELVLDLTWRECGASRIRRGAAAPFTQAEMGAFLDSLPARIFLRGHDPDLTGRSVFGDRCLTLHTTRYYERFGGVLAARVPLDRPVNSVKDLRVEHLASEGQTYPEPIPRVD